MFIDELLEHINNYYRCTSLSPDVDSYDNDYE